MRILIADDNLLVRRGIMGLLAQQENLVVCGQASDAAEAIQRANELRPDLILLDVSMPGTNGLETARTLKQQLPQIQILIISQHDPKPMLARSSEVGADGCLDKARLATDLLPTIRNLQNRSFEQTA